MIVCKEISFEDDLSWDDLIEKSITATFFQTKEWLILWRKHFPIENVIYGIYNNEELIGIVPLSITPLKGSTLKGVDFLGVTKVLNGELVSDFGDIIAMRGKEEEVWEAVLKELNNETMKQYNNGKVEFNFIREDSPSLEILKSLGGIVEEVDNAPFLLLPESWEEYLVSLDRHNRHELKRKMRKTENEEVQIVLSSGSSEDIKELFRLMEISDVEKKRFLTEKMKDFFRDVIITFYKQKKAELIFLRKDEVNIAATLSFQFRNEVLLYNSGFDPQFGYLSIGLVLKAHLIKRAIEQKKKSFDFLRGGERYKFDLGGKARKLYNISFEN